MLGVGSVKKSKKNEARYFRSIVRVDRTAFGTLSDQVRTLQLFWKSTETRFLLATWTTPASTTVVGYAAYQLKPGSCYLLRIAVDSHWQGKGVGRALFAHLCDLAPLLQLEVSDDNLGAIAFYKKMRMTEVRHRAPSASGTCGFFDFELEL